MNEEKNKNDVSEVIGIDKFKILIIFLFIFFTLIFIFLIFLLLLDFNVLNFSVKNISLNDSNLDFKISNVKINNESSISVLVKRGEGEGNFSKLKFVIIGENKTETIYFDFVLNKSEERNFDLFLKKINVSNLERIEVYPVIKMGLFKEELSEKKGSFEFFSISNSINQDDGKNTIENLEDSGSLNNSIPKIYINGLVSSSGGGSSGGGSSGGSSEEEQPTYPLVFRTFYISNSGSDSNNGFSESTPWKTISKLNNQTFLPGDTILFKSGDIWNESLEINYSGNSTHPITFSSYGTGEKPLISGLIVLGDNWENIGGNIWRYNVSSLQSKKIRYLLLNGTNMNMSKMSPINNYADNGTRVSFIDSDLNGSSGDYVGSEVLMRTTSYSWEIRNVTGYNSTTKNVSFSPSVSYALKTTGGSSGGYFFQNSLKILQDNSIQNEWVNQGDYIYYYSSINPFNLGEIQISSIDTLFNLGINNSYLRINNLSFSYANKYAILGENNSYKQITNCSFERVNVGIMEENLSSSNSLIDGNLFNNIGSIGIHQRSPINLTITNNNLSNIGLEIGRMHYVGNFGSISIWYSGIIAYGVDGGLFEYNNLREIGYNGIALNNPSNQVLVQHNYVENPCVILVDGGAYYSYSENESVYSNINTITYRKNIAAITNFSNMDFLIGFENSPYGASSWTVYGFYKDGWLRATNWIDNFAYGFKYPFYSNPSKYSTWINNTGIATKVKLGGLGVFFFHDISPRNITDSNISGNIMINANDSNPILYVYSNQINSSSNNYFDYNVILKPVSFSRASMILRYPGYNYTSFPDWKNLSSGKHQTTDVFFFNYSGLSNIDNFTWIAINPSKNNVSVSFPSNYRYYTIFGDPVFEDTLEPYAGKVYYRTLDEGMPQATNVSISGSGFVGELHSGLYNYTHEKGNLESGSVYQWYISYDGTIEAREAIPGATSINFTPTSNLSGQYLIFGIQPKSSVGSGNLIVGIERFSSPVYLNAH